MKRSLLALILLAGTSTTLMAEEDLPSRLAQDSLTPLSFTRHRSSKSHSNAITFIKKAGTITEPGSYVLTRDIKGTIVIASNNVSLDLNSHVVNGNGAPAAISTNGFKNITIKNGAITNAGSLGIDATNTTGFNLENVQVYLSNRALAMTGCQSSQVNSFKAYQNTNTDAAVVLVDTCDSVKLSNVQANNNIKALNASVGNTDPGIGIITVFNSNNVTLTDCTTNSNTRTNNNSRFAPLVGLFSTSVSFINCQSNNNTISVDDIRAFAPIHCRLCLDTVIESCQANGNKLGSTIQFFRPIYVIDTPRNIIKNCQVNDNVLQLLGTNPGFAIDLSGIVLFAATAPLTDTVISHCQVSGNSVIDGGTSSDTKQTVGIHILGFNEGQTDIPGMENRTVIEDCQVNDNTMVSQQNLQTVFGIRVLNVEDNTIANCSFDGNSGGSQATAVAIDDEGRSKLCRKVKILNSTMNDTSSRDFAAGVFLGGVSADELRGSSECCDIIGCQAHRNRASAGYGILIQNALSCSIINCQTNQNTSTGVLAGPAAGSTFFDPAPVNRNCSIINCSAKENGANGFELSNAGSNNDFLVQDNIALANGGVGFLHGQAVLTSAFLGNYARDNGKDYSIVGGTIQLHTLHLSTGKYSNTSGDRRLTKLTNIRAVTP